MSKIYKYIIIVSCAVLTVFLAVANAQNDKSWAQYIQTADGTPLAADIWLPENISQDTLLPTMVYFTRYWRSKEFSPQKIQRNSVVNFFNEAGYAVIIVDVRGTGASYGSRAGEFTLQETKDFGAVFDWVIKQSWSNGNLATFGISYAGNTAEHSSFIKHPALKAIVPRFTDFDWYRSLVFPGGFRNKIIASNWGDMVWAMDLNKFGVGEGMGTLEKPVILGVRPVDNDGDKTQLAEAVEQHKNNINVATSLRSVEYRDDKKSARSLDDDITSFVTPFRFMKEAEEAAVPAFHWGGWGDSGTAAGILARYSSYNATGLYVIGPWNHGARQDVNPFKVKDAPVQPSQEDQYKQILAFLDPYMRTGSKAQENLRELRYFTMGEDIWKTTKVWPPQDTHNQTLYLAEDNRLSEDKTLQKSGSDGYKVNFEVGTGSSTRWSTQLGGSDVFYGNRAEVDRDLLVYDSEPLESAMEITGTPVVDIYLSSSHGDGGIIAYLEMISPEGIVTMITEGELRFIHRKISDEAPPYVMSGPYHTFERKDAALMPVGDVEKISFSLLPTSILIPKGYSIRLALAGHDKDSFLRIPERGDPVWSVQRNAEYSSSLSLPVISKVSN
ncbi:MAG: CocE/NonD family hydrolase [Emcibacter sp.]|nr:CocE/NonD family hydrolase [Emcibacter sp.]